jgi:radical SAM superfamily enzyme YgiQ (UPF0313 family)
VRLLIISPSWLPETWRGGRTLSPPMSLPVLASLCPPDAKIHLVDEHVEAVDLKEDADLVALSFMTAAAPRAYAVADSFRARKIPVVMGGMHPSALPNEAAHHADAVVVGEAETQWRQVLADFAAGKLRPLYDGAGHPELNALPHPRRDLLRREKYLVPNLVQTARGCPHACTFCSVSPVFGRRYRFRPVDEVIDEVRSLDSRSIGFVDDNIVARPSRAKELFEALIPLKLQWVGQGDLSMAKDPEMLRLMRRSGCLAMFIGIESISQDSLIAAHKRPNVGLDYESTIATIHKHGIDIIGSFVFGLDPDTVESCRKTVDFAMRTKLAAAQFAVLTPFPGTPVYDQMRAEHRILDSDWSHYTMNHVVFSPANMTAAELGEARAYACRRFSSVPSIARRLCTLRGGWRRLVTRAVTNVSYRRVHQGRPIMSRVPHDGAIAKAPMRA